MSARLHCVRFPTMANAAVQMDRMGLKILGVTPAINMHDDLAQGVDILIESTNAVWFAFRDKMTVGKVIY